MCLFYEQGRRLERLISLLCVLRGRGGGAGTLKRVVLPPLSLIACHSFELSNQRVFIVKEVKG